MAFIEKKDPIVLNIKLTTKGRELLSKGNLNFKYFAIGDSEIDYGFNTSVNNESGTNELPYNSLILRAADKNPSILSNITKSLDGNPYNEITNVPSTPTMILNSVEPLGFFNVGNTDTTFITDPDHVKQPDVMVKIKEISGGNQLNLYKSPTYSNNLNTVEVGDLILIKWTNPNSTSTTENIVNKLNATPYLMYKVQTVSAPSGGLSNHIATITVDRELPKFNNTTTNVVAGAIIYYDFKNYVSNTIQEYDPTEYLDESVLAFLQNCQCPVVKFPFWNLNIVYTDEIAGVSPEDRKYTQFRSKNYGGFVSYIQNQSPVYKKLGIIHYTNQSPSNVYAEEFYQDTPTLDIPTIMWHKSPNSELGVVLGAYGDRKVLSGETKSLNTTYYDLADTEGNIVGKIFNDLKLFVIEDQELLFAMSYKSNRSWTLPNYSVGINGSATLGCPDCEVEFRATGLAPTFIGTNTAKIGITDIINTVGIMPDVDLVLSISGATHGLVYFEPIVGNTLVSDLYADTYHVIIYDLRTVADTCVGQTVVIGQPNSNLSIYDISSTGSKLNPDFMINRENPAGTEISISKDDVGEFFGTPTIEYRVSGSTGTAISLPFTGANVNISGLSFKEAYSITIKDTVTTPEAAVFEVTLDYVAVGNSLKPSFLVSSLLTDENGKYVLIADYLTSISPTVNPIVGEIEFSLHKSDSYPTSWAKLPAGSAVGSEMKLYVNNNVMHVLVRERYKKTVISSVSKQITVNYDDTGAGGTLNAL